jgi:hypothetical protein
MYSHSPSLHANMHMTFCILLYRAHVVYLCRPNAGSKTKWITNLGSCYGCGGGGVQIKLIEILARTIIHTCTKLFGSCAHIPVIIPFNCAMWVRCTLPGAPRSRRYLFFENVRMNIASPRGTSSGTRVRWWSVREECDSQV